MTASTPLEALVAEMLGDIGKLHDMIKALPDALKGSLAPTLGSLVIVSKEAQQRIEQLGEAERIAFNSFTAADKLALRDSIVSALPGQAGKALAQVASELATAAEIHREAISRETAQRWQWIAVAFAVGLFASSLGFYGSHLLYDEQQEKQAAYGRAVGTVWDSLDAKTKERIQAARNNQ